MSTFANSYSEYTLHGNYCRRELPTVLAVPIIYNTTDDSHDVLTDTTTTLTDATLAVWTINALFQERDKDVLGLTYEEEIRDENGGGGGGLSLGSRIGIGIGATLGGLLLIGLVLFLLCKRHRGCKKEDADAANDTRGLGMRSRTNPSDLPPPAYEFTERNSLADDDDDSMRGGEIQVLRAQKAAIQRRIEELQRVETTEEVQQR